MRYEAYSYLWPPRPETKIPPDLMRFYQDRGWWAQVKKNGTCTVVFARGSSVVFKTRHDDDHKAWTPSPEVTAPFLGRPDFNVYVGELLHSKGVGVRNHLYLFDMLVNDGEHLSGVSFADRQAILRERFPIIGDQSQGLAGVGANMITRNVSMAQCYALGFDRVWTELGVNDEGIVLKDPAALLRPCISAVANAGWQVKCRKPKTSFSF